MNEGAIEQVGTPSDIYSRPRTRFVASFVGTLNMFDGVVADPARGAIRLGETTIFSAAPIGNARAGDARTIALRPEALRFGAGGGANVLSAVIEDMSFLGAVVRLQARLGETPFHIDTFNAGGAAPPRPGETIEIGFAPEDVIVLDGP